MYRVQKLLSNYGYCSRRKAEDLIAQGRVKVNGKVITLGDKATKDDTIMVDNNIVASVKNLYLMFNKPAGCVTAVTDAHEKTVMEYIDIKERIFPVGRLDKDTTGLLLLTNDGDFANKVMHPSNEVTKTYLAELDKEVYDSDLKQIEEGILLEDGKTSPCRTRKLSRNIVEVIIHEGRNRIVKRLFEALGYKTLSLKRIRIGKLGIGSLPVGRYKALSREELDLVFSKS